MLKYFLAACVLIWGCSPVNDNSEKERAAVAKLAEFVNTMSPSRGRGQGMGMSDMSAGSWAKTLQTTREQLSTLRSIDSASLHGDDLIDWKFAQSILVGRELDQSAIQPWKKDPRIYLAFTGISGLIHSPGDTLKKIEEVSKRLKLIPIQLANGKAQLEYYVQRFQELAVFMAENSFVLFDKELGEFIGASPFPPDSLSMPIKEARAALEDYLKFLKTELPSRTPGTFSMGAGPYNEMLLGHRW